MLPIEAASASTENGWSVRLPVREEHVTVQPQAFIYERVVIKRNPVVEVARVRDLVKREELRGTNV